jgi:hypothetical protein
VPSSFDVNHLDGSRRARERTAPARATGDIARAAVVSKSKVTGRRQISSASRSNDGVTGPSAHCPPD